MRNLASKGTIGTDGTDNETIRNNEVVSFYCTGIRATDFIQLRWRNVSSEGRLTYSMDKNGKFCEIGLVPQALDILKQDRA